MGESKTKVIVKAGRVDSQGLEISQDNVAAEVQFQVKTSKGHCFGVRCTPENLEELTLGQLFFHGYIQDVCQAEKIEIFPESGEIRVQIEEPLPILKAKVSGKEEKEQKRLNHLEAAELFRKAEEIFLNPGPLFVQTGCAHGCALYCEGKVLCKREDIGRHNALDKIIGYGLKEGLDFKQMTVFTTGRVSGDYMEKIIKSGISAVVSRAAVTDEAERKARAHKVALYGFVRKGAGNQYAPEI